MKNRYLILAATLALVAFFAGWTAARPQRWEYKQVCAEGELEGLGADGWELVAVTATSSTCYYLKREK